MERNQTTSLNNIGAEVLKSNGLSPNQDSIFTKTFIKSLMDTPSYKKKLSPSRFLTNTEYKSILEKDIVVTGVVK